MKPQASITVAQLRKSLKKYHGNMQVWVAGEPIKAVRITAIDERFPPTCVVRLIRQSERRA